MKKQKIIYKKMIDMVEGDCFINLAGGTSIFMSSYESIICGKTHISFVVFPKSLFTEPYKTSFSYSVREILSERRYLGNIYGKLFI